MENHASFLKLLLNLQIVFKDVKLLLFARISFRVCNSMKKKNRERDQWWLSKLESFL